MKRATEAEIFQAYTKRVRILTPEYTEDLIPWHLDGNASPDPDLFRYIQHIEALTAVVYGPYLELTPSGRHPVISVFLKRWVTEETTHGELFARYLQLRGIEIHPLPQHTGLDRFFEVIRTLPENLAGSAFITLHMVWGAANEFTTLALYQRIRKLSRDPVLSAILDGVIIEEGRHAMFYNDIARLRLGKSRFEQIFVRTVMKLLWQPVGSGDLDPTPALQIFAGDGIHIFCDKVTARINRLPGLADLCLTLAVQSAMQKRNIPFLPEKRPTT
ncbi:MAG: ferritin-like domain-containing protein [Patescibacteria group bacterium]